jgi:molybdenum cofactor biosynthesis enzyme MoaA
MPEETPPDTNALEALQYLATWFDGAVGRLTPDYGEVTGKHFQAMTMCPDPEKLAKAMASLPAIIATLRTEQALAERDAEIETWRGYAQEGIRQCSNPDCATCDDLRALIRGDYRSASDAE